VDAWRWAASDRILHALPLHHIHGIVNALHCAHAAGACVDFMTSFQPNAAWRRLRVRSSARLRWLRRCSLQLLRFSFLRRSRFVSTAVRKQTGAAELTHSCTHSGLHTVANAPDAAVNDTAAAG
jgi:acyl-CoA synthetase (AMP-forming)/AMP-acid ligase II